MVESGGSSLLLLCIHDCPICQQGTDKSSQTFWWMSYAALLLDCLICWFSKRSQRLKKHYIQLRCFWPEGYSWMAQGLWKVYCQVSHNRVCTPLESSSQDSKHVMSLIYKTRSWSCQKSCRKLDRGAFSCSSQIWLCVVASISLLFIRCPFSEPCQCNSAWL